MHISKNVITPQVHVVNINPFFIVIVISVQNQRKYEQKEHTAKTRNYWSGVHRRQNYGRMQTCTDLPRTYNLLYNLTIVGPCSIYFSAQVSP